MRDPKPYRTMKPISLNIMAYWINAVDDLVRRGFYPHRAAAIRAGVRDLVKLHRDAQHC